MTMYICEHFDIRELISRELFQEYESEQWRLWMMFDDRALKILDFLSENLGATIVNTWHSTRMSAAYGFRDESGLRVKGMKYYKPTSQHSFGRGFDTLFRYHRAQDVRKDIIEGKTVLPFATRLEKAVSWFHFDTGNVNAGDYVTLVNG